MPRFSIIIPAYQVQAFLPECLDSVLSQSFRDFELIGVDDASPDACGEILDKFAADDRRITAVHLAENAGLGGARNAGVARASGDYLLFLDSDDTLLPGALDAIARRLTDTGDPDVVVFDYARTYETAEPIAPAVPTGTTGPAGSAGSRGPAGAGQPVEPVEPVRNARAELLVQRDPQVFAILERPDLLRLLAVVWNKAYRRDWIERLGLTFPRGYYEDVAWTYPALLAARRITCLDRVCVHYRQRTGGNILGTESRRHFDLFDQYDRVFAFLDGRPEFDGLRPLIFRRAVDHVCAVLNKPGRVPRRARREFFARGHRLYRRHRPAGYRPPPGPAGVRHRLLGAGTPLLYQALLHTRRAWLRTRSAAATTTLVLPPTAVGPARRRRPTAPPAGHASPADSTRDPTPGSHGRSSLPRD